MAQTMQTTQTGLTRILARFGRRNDQHNPWRDDRGKSHWYDCDVSCRGL